MFYIPAGMLAATNTQYVAKAEELYGITANQCSDLLSLGSASSFLFVTIGNILGGMVFVGILCYLSQKRNGNKRRAANYYVGCLLFTSTLPITYIKSSNNSVEIS